MIGGLREVWDIGRADFRSFLQTDWEGGLYKIVLFFPEGTSLSHPEVLSLSLFVLTSLVLS